MMNYEDWVDSLDAKELQEMYMLGGEESAFGLMTAYHIQMSEAMEFQREEQRDMELFEKEAS